MEVIDARQAFYRWSDKRLDHLLSQYEPAQQVAIQLIPLLLQTNHRFLPGYNGADTPAGIFGYMPDKKLIRLAKQLNRRFQYEQKTVLKNTLIDAVYLQHDVVEDKLVLWLMHRPGMKPGLCRELDDKLRRILLWLNSRDIRVSGHLLEGQLIARHAPEFVSPALFLDQFYAQACLLAGKYPAWWLVPPEQETEYPQWLEHMRAVRYVNPDEYLDLGGLHELSQNDIFKQAISYMKGIYHSPEKGCLRLMLLAARQAAWPQIESLASRLKSSIYLQSAGAATDVADFLAGIVGDYLQAPEDRLHLMAPSRMFDLLGHVSRDSSRSLFQYLGWIMHAATPAHQRTKLDTFGFINLYRALFQEIRQAFSHIITLYNYHGEEDEEQQSLNAVARNLMVYLSDSDERISIYNVRDMAEFIIGRIVIRHAPDQEEGGQWQLIMEAEESGERVIDAFPNLLSLIAWARLNRIVDQATQISMDCPSRMVRQVDARYVLEVLMQRIRPDDLVNISGQVFQQPSSAQRSLLFTNLVAGEDYRQRLENDNALDPLMYEATDDLVVNCEQLVVNNWGDVHVRRYSGSLGVLQCLCDWIQAAGLGPTGGAGSIHCYGYAAGISTFWAQRIEQLFEETAEFFRDEKKRSGRFIVRMGPEYYLLEAIDHLIQPRKIGNQAALFRFLEQPNKEFRPYGMERYALTETPLRAVFERNRKAVVQVFFQIQNRDCHTWVMDEKGGLWHQQQPWFDRSSYVAHWLYLMRNIRNRLKRINYQNRELPAIELQQIVNNPLGGLDFHPVGAEAISTEQSFYDIHLSVFGDEQGDQLSMSCDGHEFNYLQYHERVINECADYISARLAVEGRKPIYITDIDVPLRLYDVAERDDIQVLHFLRYIRTIETRLNRMVFG